jgi:hypothetical protein
MDGSVEVLRGVTVGLFVGLVVYATYRWQQRRRVRRVEQSVQGYLVGRYGELPSPVEINCSDDRRWPVLVNFTERGAGIRHRLQFDCPGSGAALSLRSDKQESCSEKP